MMLSNTYVTRYVDGETAISSHEGVWEKYTSVWHHLYHLMHSTIHYVFIVIFDHALHAHWCFPGCLSQYLGHPLWFGYCCPATWFWCINYLCLKICSLLCRTVILLVQGLDPFFEELATIRCIMINFIIEKIQNSAYHFLFIIFEKVPCSLLLTILLLLSWMPVALLSLAILLSSFLKIVP